MEVHLFSSLLNLNGNTLYRRRLNIHMRCRNCTEHWVIFSAESYSKPKQAQTHAVIHIHIWELEAASSNLLTLAGEQSHSSCFICCSFFQLKLAAICSLNSMLPGSGLIFISLGHNLTLLLLQLRSAAVRSLPFVTTKQLHWSTEGLIAILKDNLTKVLPLQLCRSVLLI